MMYKLSYGPNGSITCPEEDLRLFVPSLAREWPVVKVERLVPQYGAPFADAVPDIAGRDLAFL
jgi:hypothetical protein